MQAQPSFISASVARSPKNYEPKRERERESQACSKTCQTFLPGTDVLTRIQDPGIPSGQTHHGLPGPSEGLEGSAWHRCRTSKGMSDERGR